MSFWHNPDVQDAQKRREEAKQNYQLVVEPILLAEIQRLVWDHVPDAVELVLGFPEVYNDEAGTATIRDSAGNEYDVYDLDEKLHAALELLSDDMNEIWDTYGTIELGNNPNPNKLLLEVE